MSKTRDRKNTTFGTINGKIVRVQIAGNKKSGVRNDANIKRWIYFSRESFIICEKTKNKRQKTLMRNNTLL